MKYTLLSLAFVLFTTISFATEIEARVVFENLTEKELTSGEFTILGLNHKTEVNNTESFIIVLPKRGSYQFSFDSNEFTAYTLYPKRITNTKNTITVRLMAKRPPINIKLFAFSWDAITTFTDEQLEAKISEGTLSFIMHGIDSSIPEHYIKFMEKYGIGLIKANCVVDASSFRKAKENNQRISDYLNKKYGSKWLGELDSKPFGIK